MKKCAMKEIVTKKINNYTYILMGLIIAIIGYTYSSLSNWDIVEGINKYLSFTRKYRLDETFFIWGLFFLFFTVLNFIVLFKRKMYLQKKKAYSSMLNESNYIIKKLLYQLQIIRMEAENNASFDKQVLRMFDSSIEEAITMVDKLSHIKNLDKDPIFKTIVPKKEYKDQNMKMDLFEY